MDFFLKTPINPTGTKCHASVQKCSISVTKMAFNRSTIIGFTQADILCDSLNARVVFPFPVIPCIIPFDQMFKRQII